MRVEILLNNVVVETHHLTKAEIVVPEESAELVKDGLLLYDLQQSESGLYKDTEALYSRAITANVQ